MSRMSEEQERLAQQYTDMLQDAVFDLGLATVLALLAEVAEATGDSAEEVNGDRMEANRWRKAANRINTVVENLPREFAEPHR